MVLGVNGPGGEWSLGVNGPGVNGPGGEWSWGWGGGRGNGPWMNVSRQAARGGTVSIPVCTDLQTHFPSIDFRCVVLG